MFDVQALVPQERIVSELLLHVAEEMSRQIGEDVFNAVRRQKRHQVRGRGTGTAADLEDAQAPTLGKLFYDHAQGILSDEVVEPPHNPILVELLGVSQRSAGEDELERVDIAAQNLAQ